MGYTLPAANAGSKTVHQPVIMTCQERILAFSQHLFFPLTNTHQRTKKDTHRKEEIESKDIKFLQITEIEEID